MPQLFISYRRDDSAAYTGRLIDRLSAQFPYVEIFHDVKTIPAGTDFKAYTKEKLSSEDIFLLIIGPRWTTYINDRIHEEDFVRFEVEMAMEQGCKILPVYVGEANPPSSADLPPSLKKLAYINGLPLRSDPDFDNDLQRISEFLKEEVKLRTSFIQKMIQKAKRTDLKLLLGIGGAAIILWFLIGLIGKKKNCKDAKIAAIVSNFSEDERDGFSNTLIVMLDESLPDSAFNVRGGVYQDRNIDDYNSTIRETYFANSCDTNGLFINGYRNVEQKVFNFYATNVGIQLDAPDYIKDNAISIAQIKNAEFIVTEDAELIHDFIIVWLDYYLVKSSDFIRKTYEFQQKHNINLNDAKRTGTLSTSILGPLYLMRADHYAIEGNEKRAIQLYKEVIQMGNEHITEIAKLNLKEAQPIADMMYNDEKLRMVRANNVAEHDKIESGFQKFLRELGEAIEKFFRAFKKK